MAKVTNGAGRAVDTRRVMEELAAAKNHIEVAPGRGCVAREQRPMEAALQRLNDDTAKLHAVLDMFEDRVSPVLRPMAPPAGTSAASPTEAPAGMVISELREVSAKLEHAVARIAVIHERCEV